MSPPKKVRKIQSDTGKEIPKRVNNVANVRFAQVIADALHSEFGGTHAAIKSVSHLTAANERAVKNWFMAKNGPTGHHLVDLMRASDKVLEAVLRMSGRQELVIAKKFADSKVVLIEMLRLIDDLQHDAAAGTTARTVGRRPIDELLDQTLFELDAEKYDAFVAMLDKPPRANAALKALMKRRPLWQK